MQFSRLVRHYGTSIWIPNRIYYNVDGNTENTVCRLIQNHSRQPALWKCICVASHIQLQQCSPVLGQNLQHITTEQTYIFTVEGKLDVCNSIICWHQRMHLRYKLNAVQWNWHTAQLLTIQNILYQKQIFSGFKLHWFITLELFVCSTAPTNSWQYAPDTE